MALKTLRLRGRPTRSSRTWKGRGSDIRVSAFFRRVLAFPNLSLIDYLTSFFLAPFNSHVSPLLFFYVLAVLFKLHIMQSGPISTNN